MKKILFMLIMLFSMNGFVAAVAMLAGINVFNAQKTIVLSDVSLENGELLCCDNDQN